MDNDINKVSNLVRREIEALIAVPLIRVFMDERGRGKAIELAGSVIKELALESGKMLAAISGGDTMKHLADVFSFFSMGGALEFDVLAATDNKLSLNVTRCRYAEMYKKHGIEEFGYLLSCGRDFALIEGFNPGIKLTRTQTIMEGADCCDFCFTQRDEYEDGEQM